MDGFCFLKKMFHFSDEKQNNLLPYILRVSQKQCINTILSSRVKEKLRGPSSDSVNANFRTFKMLCERKGIFKNVYLTKQNY